ncbi:MFS transporter [Salinarimonas ramus]|uniref:MFS transporter n=1 Tax=Salinarimonas ramus TaxID=690164 RepID=A0A917Q7E7_9HYPH|nr:MFS transporter [Salinarimonas ramus]GGK33199.1 MFS transporter [Salinarimonas ramus]
MNAATSPASSDVIDARPAWIRLAIAVCLSSLGGVGMWSVVVVMPAVEATFEASRASSALAYTVLMLAFAGGGVAMGRIADRTGIVPPLIAGALLLATGYAASAAAPSLLLFVASHALVGLGASATLGPLIAEVSHWFRRRRGIAVAICAAGNYVAGAIWPPIVQSLVETSGWRTTHLVVAGVLLCTMIPLALTLRRRAPVAAQSEAHVAPPGRAALGLSTNALTALLFVAGIACCVAMAMPQVHIVAYCAELGFGTGAGAQMLSLMMLFGIVSRIASGFIADRIGGLATLLLGSTLQALALLLYMLVDGLAALYVVSALFGLFQGGIVPSYAIVVREYFPPAEAGMRVGLVLMATILGMAFGGWLSGAIFDATGAYSYAFLNGLAWNLLNMGVIAMLLMRRGRRLVPA